MLDHFNGENVGTFRQRYLVNDTWFGGRSSPILFYCGAEGAGVPSIFEHSGYVLALAKELKALVVFGEMRFFGDSMPFGEDESFRPDPTHLGLLSVEQALADDASLILKMKERYDTPGSPVVALGGSLAGTLAYMLRQKYPHVVSMALASSAPILGYPDLTSPFGWYRVATHTYESQAPGCPAAVRRAFSTLLAAGAPQLSRAYNACTPIRPTQLPRVVGWLVATLTGSLAARAESAYPLARSPVVEACATVAAASGSLSAFAPLVVPHGSCLDVSRLEATGLAVRPGSLAARGRVGGPKTANKAWDYLACTEIVHPIAANNVSDMFPPQTWSVDALSAGCRREFHAAPRPAWMPRSMGMARGAAHLADATSHVIFTNGLLDPWSAQSVTQNVSSTLVAINIPDGSHHSDLGAPPNPDVSEADSPTLRAARAQQLAILKGWLEERATPTVAVA